MNGTPTTSNQAVGRCKFDGLKEGGQMTVKVALYCRRSTDDQEMSNEIQLEALETEAQKRGMKVVGRYRDTISGSVPAKDRPAFRQLWAAIKRGEVNAVMVLRMDRLTRAGAVDLLHIAEELSALNVALISTQEPGLSVYGPAGKLVLTVMAAVGEYERALIIDRTRKGRTAAKARGVRFGRKPKAVDPKAVTALRAQGLSWRAVARQLGVSIGKAFSAGSGCFREGSTCAVET